MGRIIEKNCKTSIVNGRIIVSDSFKSPIIEDDVAIRNLQPFQIYGRKVVPCRVTTDSDATNGIAYMPQIGGIDMDEPNAALTGSGSFYLNVTWKYDVGDLTFKIDPDNVPFISNENLGAMLSYEVDIDGNVGDFLQNISSWRIGGIEAGVVQNYMRYFHGYEGGNVDATENNLYKKGRFFPDEWGVASIGFVVNGLTRDVPCLLYTSPSPRDRG